VDYLLAGQPDQRRCVAIPVVSVPIEQRVEAVREYNKDWVDDPAERLVLFDLALHPPIDLLAWVSKSALTNGNGKPPPRAKLTRDEVERIFDLHEQGLSYSTIAEQIQRNPSTVKSIGSEGREAALRRYDAAEERGLARLIRGVLVRSLADWQPWPRVSWKRTPPRARPVLKRLMHDAVVREMPSISAAASIATLPEPRPPRTHCKRGHEFTAENTIVRSDGTRTCRACRRASSLAYYHRQRETTNGNGAAATGLQPDNLGRVIRAALSERLAGWVPFAANGNGETSQNGSVVSVTVDLTKLLQRVGY
jgi:Helix-turn-helix domain